MSESIRREIKGLQGQTVAQLREKYREVLGEDSRSNHQQYLVRRIAWRLQAEAEGGLSERAQRRAEELARDADLRLGRPHQRKHPTRRDLIRDPRLPKPGAVVTRTFQGRLTSVEILEHGFRHEGCVYRSLSAIARRVSGTAWNGFSFFGRALREAAGSAQISGSDRNCGRGRDLVSAHGNVNADEATNPRGGTD